MKTIDIFKVAQREHVAWLTLNRPEKRNAMGLVFFNGLNELFAGFDADPRVRAVVITAEGKSFTAGTDIEEIGAILGGGTAEDREDLRKNIQVLQNGINAIELCRKPVIVAIHGHCIGGGVDLACACDIRLADRSAVFSVRETRMGIIADLGTLQRLPHIVGHGWTRDLALTGRDFDAFEALKMGFITRLCDDRNELLAAAEETATMIANCPPLTVQGVKEVINYSREHSVTTGLQYVAQKNAAALPSEDLLEAFHAFKEKRAPNFKGK
jgi:enoyl-CoA hydratase